MKISCIIDICNFLLRMRTTLEVVTIEFVKQFGNVIHWQGFTDKNMIESYILTRITNQGSRDYKTGQLLGNTNRSRFRDYKTGQKDCKLEQGLQNGAKRLQIGAGITNCISIWIFCTQFICLAFDGLLQSKFFSNVLFQTFDYFGKNVPNKLSVSLCWHILHKI